MSESIYLQRMQELRRSKADVISKQTGLPLQKPMNGKPTGLAASPMSQQEEAQKEMPNMDSFFGRTFQQMEGEDKRFGTMFEDLHKLANGLRAEVAQGFMPEPIARKKLEQYVQDSSKWFSQNQPGLMDNPQMSQAIEGVLKNAYEKSQNNLEPVAPQGQQMPQEQPMPPQGGM